MNQLIKGLSIFGVLLLAGLAFMATCVHLMGVFTPEVILISFVLVVVLALSYYCEVE